MTTTARVKRQRRERNDYTRAILSLHPQQGEWSEEEYLQLTDSVNRPIEFTDGFIEVLPMPTDKHQAISQFLLLALLTWVQRMGGKVHYSPLRVQIRPKKYREPDLVLLRDAHDPRRQNRFWLGADLAIEIVSADKPERDLVDKVADYAEGNIPEYWIVNPDAQTITVLRLEGDAYVPHGVFARGQRATSALLDGFSVSVDAALDAE